MKRRQALLVPAFHSPLWFELVVELQSELNLPFALRTRDMSQRTPGENRRGAQDGGIGKVDEIGSELELARFGERNPFHQAHIEVAQPRAAYDSVAAVSESEWRWS